MRLWKSTSLLFRKNIRSFGSSSITSQKFSSPLSVGLTPRFMGQKDFDLYYHEDLIMELLRNITLDIPVSEPEVPYLEMADRPWKKTLPLLPESNLDDLNSYVQDLTFNRYDASTNSTIEQILLKIVSETPETLTKKSYLGIVGHFHFMVQDSKAFEVIDKMTETTKFDQDIDFDNQLLAYSNTRTEYRFRVRRLESMKDAGKIANTGTWYSIYRMFDSDSARLKMLDAMDEYGISLGPVMKSATYCLSKSFKPDALIDFYEKRGIIKKDNDKNKLQGLPDFYLNRLVECFLKDHQVEEAYNLLNNDSNINMGTLSAFIEYFIKNDQLVNCFPFSQLFQKRFSMGTREVLNSIIVRNLPYTTYFDNWDSITRILVNHLSKKTNTKTFLSGKTIKELKNYAKIHGIKDFDPFKIKKKDISNANFLFKSLKWENDRKLHLDWELNSKEFKKAAKWFGQHSMQDEETIEPSSLL